MKIYDRRGSLTPITARIHLKNLKTSPGHRRTGAPRRWSPRWSPNQSPVGGDQPLVTSVIYCQKKKLCSRLEASIYFQFVRYVYRVKFVKVYHLTAVVAAAVRDHTAVSRDLMLIAMRWGGVRCASFNPLPDGRRIWPRPTRERKRLVSHPSSPGDARADWILRPSAPSRRVRRRFGTLT